MTGLVMELTAALVTSTALADATRMWFADAWVETGGFIVMRAKGVRDKFALLRGYHYKLGQHLNRRTPGIADMAEMQRLCRSVDQVARSQHGHSFDGYGIEFADGTGDTFRFPLCRRTDFFFWAKDRVETCARTPSKGRLL